MLSECIYKVLMASGVVTSSDACDLSGAIETAVLEAQGKQEPVAWLARGIHGGKVIAAKLHNYKQDADNTASVFIEHYGAAETVPLFAAPVVQPGYKLLKDSTHDERSWSEDSSHENGAYFCLCHHCGRQFTGHKRRVTCKVCTGVIAAAEGKG